MSTLDFDAWLRSGTVNTETVTIHLDQEAGAECEALAAELEALTSGPGKGERAVGERDPLADLQARWDAAFARWQAGTTTWTVRASSEEDEDAAFEAVPRVKMPKRPLDKAGRKALSDYQDRLAEALEESGRKDIERQTYLTALCVTRIESPDGTVADHATPDQIQALRSMPGGRVHYDRLTAAVNRATEGRQEAPRPTSPERSTSDRA